MSSLYRIVEQWETYTFIVKWQLKQRSEGSCSRPYATLASARSAPWVKAARRGRRPTPLEQTRIPRTTPRPIAQFSSFALQTQTKRIHTWCPPYMVVSASTRAVFSRLPRTLRRIPATQRLMVSYLMPSPSATCSNELRVIP